MTSSDLTAGRTIQCVGACRRDGNSNERMLEVDREMLERTFAS